MKKCKRCGCDFPNNEYSEFGCLYCEAEEDSIIGSIKKLKKLLDNYNKLNDPSISFNELEDI